MSAVAYPQELQPSWWAKKKPTLAKTKKTGIGEALKALETLHDKITWTLFDTHNTTTAIDKLLAELPKLCKQQIDPCVKKAKEVETLAKKWASEFTKEKLMPKAAAEAATAVAKAARNYATAMEDYEGHQANALVAKRKEVVVDIRKAILPMLTKTSAKIDGLLVDIAKYCQQPTEENFWKIFVADSNARGYTTGCKNWDQVLVEFPEIRKQCFNGKAMEVYFPGMAVYGANYDPQDFETKVNGKLGKTGEEAYRWHAQHLAKEVANVKKFGEAVAKCITLLK